MKEKTVNSESKEFIEEFKGTGKQYIIPVLRRVQEKEGYISEENMDLISKKLDVPVSQVYAVVTFYSYFRLLPIGKHLIRPCQGTACHVKGAKRIIDSMKDNLGLKDDVDTTIDNQFTVAPVACLGACGLAPVMLVDEAVHGDLDEEKAVKILEKFKKH